jgi:hypothetical protein
MRDAARRRRLRKANWLTRTLDGLDKTLATSVYIRVAKLVAGVIGFAAVIITVMQIWQDFADRREERVVRAWETVARPLPGNIGKGAALNLILGAGIAPNFVDVSCASVGGGFNEMDFSCQRHPVISGLSIVGAGTDETTLANWNLSGAVLLDMTISGTAIRNFDFRGAWTERAEIHGPLTVNGDFRNAKFHWADLSGASLSGQMRGLYIGGNISGVHFEPDLAGGVTVEEMLAGLSFDAWAWADQTPWLKVPGHQGARSLLDSLDDESTVRLCDPGGQASTDFLKRTPGECVEMSEEEAFRKYPLWPG